MGGERNHRLRPHARDHIDVYVTTIMSRKTAHTLGLSVAGPRT